MPGPRATRVDGPIAWVMGPDGVEVPVAHEMFPDLVDVSGFTPPNLGAAGDAMSQMQPQASPPPLYQDPSQAFVKQLGPKPEDALAQLGGIPALGQIGAQPTLQPGTGAMLPGGIGSKQFHGEAPVAPGTPAPMQTREQYGADRIVSPPGPQTMTEVGPTTVGTMMEREAEAQRNAANGANFSYDPSQDPMMSAGPTPMAGPPQFEPQATPSRGEVMTFRAPGRRGAALPDQNQPLTPPQQRIVQSVGGEAQTAEQLANARSAGIQQIVQTQRDAERVYAEQQARQQKERDIAQANMARASQQFDADMRDVRSQRIDPNHYWNERDTGSKIAAAIGIALGAFGQALTGGQSNVALDIINDAVSRDLAAQQENLANRRISLGEQQTQLERGHRDYGDLVMQQSADGARHWEQVIRTVENIRTGLTDPEQRAAAENIISQAQQRVDSLGMEFSRANYNDSLARARLEAANAPRGGGVRQVMMLPDGTPQYPAHGGTFTAEERRILNQLGATMQAPTIVVNGVPVQVEPTAGVGAATTAATARPDGADHAAQQLSTERRELANRLQQAGIPAAQAALREIDRVMPAGRGDVPGVGWLQAATRAAGYGLVADFVSSPEGIDLRRAAGELNNQAIRALTGAGMQREEAIRLLGTMPSVDNVSEASFRQGVEQRRRLIQDARNAIESGTNIEAVMANRRQEQQGRNSETERPRR